MLGAFELYYPVIMSFIWIIGSVFFNIFNKNIYQAVKNPDVNLPQVDIFMSCFNEEDTVTIAVNSLEKINYPNFNIILIDDKSTDNTLEIMQQLQAKYHNITIKIQANNLGKAAALNTALKNSQAKYILCVDADTTFEPNSLENLIKTAEMNPNIGAVTGRPVVQNVKTVMGKLQFLEYIMNIDAIKRAQSFFMGRIMTVSGVLTLFRRSALNQVGGWDTSALTEDIDITWRLYQAGYSCLYQPLAMCKIFVPETIRGFISQRVRWARGGVEVLQKNFTNIPILDIKRRFLALDMCASYVWIFLVAFEFFRIIFEFIFLHNLKISLLAIVIYYLVTVTFYTISKFINRKITYINYHHYGFYLPVFFYAYWINNVINVFIAFYHLFDYVKFATWKASDRGKLDDK